MKLQKYFWHSNLVTYFFATSAIKHKTEIEISNRWETTNSKPHGPIIVIDHLKTWRSNQIIFIMLFVSMCTTLLLLLPDLSKLGQSEPAPTSAPSIGCPLLFICGWSSTQLTFGFILVTNSVEEWSHTKADKVGK